MPESEMSDTFHMRNIADCGESNTTARNSPDGASLHGCGDGQGFVDVISENGTNQAVVWAVGSLDHFLDGLELHYLLDRAKDLESHWLVQWRETTISEESWSCSAACCWFALYSIVLHY